MLLNCTQGTTTSTHAQQHVTIRLSRRYILQDPAHGGVRQYKEAHKVDTLARHLPHNHYHTRCLCQEGLVTLHYSTVHSSYSVLPGYVACSTTPFRLATPSACSQYTFFHEKPATNSPTRVQDDVLHKVIVCCPTRRGTLLHHTSCITTTM